MCIADGCDRGNYAKGLCPLHYGRMLNTGSTELKGRRPRYGPPEPPKARRPLYGPPKPKRLLGPPPERTTECTVEGCDRSHEARGLCRGHYRRQRHGWSMEGPIRPVAQRDPLCTVEGCEEKHQSLGFCVMHYNRYKARGTTDPAVPRTPHSDLCSVEDCDKKRVRRTGLCNMHHQRWVKTGDTIHWCRLRECVGCAKWFSHPQPQAVTCSRTCHNRLRKANRKHYLRNGPGEKFTKAHLFARGEDRCHLCDDHVFPWETGPNEPTIDHLLPVSLGGLHTLSNVRLAHRHCNTVRGNKLLGGPELTFAYMAP